MDKTISIEAGLQNLVSTKKEDDQKIDNLSFHSKMKIVLTNISVEPVMVCLILPCIMSVIATQNLTLEKSCRVNLALGKDICDALITGNESYPGYKTHEVAVQKLAATMSIWKNIIMSLFPACLLLFLGSWSDRHWRRKPCMLISMLGEIAACLGNILCVYFFYETPLEALILAESLPTVFSGGWFSLFLGIYSYIGNITDEKTRTVRIGAIHTLYTISFCVGTSLSGILYTHIGYFGKCEISKLYFIYLFI